MTTLTYEVIDLVLPYEVTHLVLTAVREGFDPTRALMPKLAVVLYTRAIFFASFITYCKLAGMIM